ncbi:hypothetical protein ElyMa_001393800 [Elysia marginata]|uniref:Uncharacterized protein n=1 Tax=Elysia marginata TaxID=1093978 RepID=A0AAV4ITP4_9GAST|nr:hypothetical protein ElyMa_001393800 [Elysia marginata]
MRPAVIELALSIVDVTGIGSPDIEHSRLQAVFMESPPSLHIDLALDLSLKLVAVVVIALLLAFLATLFVGVPDEPSEGCPQ